MQRKRGKRSVKVCQTIATKERTDHQLRSMRPFRLQSPMDPPSYEIMTNGLPLPDTSIFSFVPFHFFLCTDCTVTPTFSSLLCFVTFSRVLGFSFLLFLYSFVFYMDVCFCNFIIAFPFCFVNTFFHFLLNIYLFFHFWLNFPNFVVSCRSMQFFQGVFSGCDRAAKHGCMAKRNRAAGYDRAAKHGCTAKRNRAAGCGCAAGRTSQT